MEESSLLPDDDLKAIFNFRKITNFNKNLLKNCFFHIVTRQAHLYLI